MAAPERTFLHGGTVVDGTGAPARPGDVVIEGDRIAGIVRTGTPPSGVRVVDCAGRVVAPGFIDIHTHSDLSLVADPGAPSKIMQGVTTEVVGNCGFSAFPADPERRGMLTEFLRGLGTTTVDVAWTDLDSYAAVLEHAPPVMNVASLVGHGSVRIAAAGIGDVSMTSEVLARMCTLLREALDQGAFGLSTGLSYVPSQYADSDEIHRLAGAVAAVGGLYASHARAHGTSASMVDETIDVGRRTGVRAQFSHIALNDPAEWGGARRLLSRFEAAAHDGVDVRFDVYPYAASASSLTQYLPAWVQVAGEEGMREVLAPGESRDRARDGLAEGLYGRIPWHWDRVLVALAGPGDEDVEGLNIAEAAALRGVPAEDVVLDLCARHGNAVQVILFYRQESDVAEFLTHPLSMLGSDGSALPVSTPGRPHPRHFGAHARLLRKYVVETRALTLQDAVYKASGAPAARLGMKHRGVLAPGAFADVVVLDLEGVRDTADWAMPQQLATGIREVWVNGAHVVAGGVLGRERVGRLLRRGE